MSPTAKKARISFGPGFLCVNSLFQGTMNQSENLAKAFLRKQNLINCMNNTVGALNVGEDYIGIPVDFHARTNIDHYLAIQGHDCSVSEI